MQFPDIRGDAMRKGDTLKAMRPGADEIYVTVSHIYESMQVVAVIWGNGHHGWIENSTEWLIVARQPTGVA
jgi:hypothetical protein